MTTKTQTVESYIAARSAPVRAVLETLRGIVKATLPDATEKMKWGAPVYGPAGGESGVYLYGGRDHANLGFLRGAELDDPAGLLEGGGKSGRHVKVFPGKALPEEELAALIRRSAALAPKAPD